MIICFQFENMNVLQHGQSVAEWYKDLMNERNLGWRLPSWINDSRIKEYLFSDELMEIYQKYHDCGKPFCKEVDEDGKQHFPNHAQVSYETWLQYSEDSKESKIIANLIKSDMDCHTIKSEDIEEFIKRPEAFSLLLTALCEVHSNAQMFGGIESTSFKIKWKKIEKLGKKMLDKIN